MMKLWMEKIHITTHYMKGLPAVFHTHMEHVWKKYLNSHISPHLQISLLVFYCGFGMIFFWQKVQSIGALFWLGSCTPKVRVHALFSRLQLQADNASAGKVCWFFFLFFFFKVNQRKPVHIDTCYDDAAACIHTRSLRWSAVLLGLMSSVSFLVRLPLPLLCSVLQHRVYAIWFHQGKTNWAFHAFHFYSQDAQLPTRSDQCPFSCPLHLLPGAPAKFYILPSSFVCFTDS